MRREARALFRVLELRLERIDVDRQPPLPPEVVPDVLVRRRWHAAGRRPARRRARMMKRLASRLAVPVVDRSRRRSVRRPSRSAAPSRRQQQPSAQRGSDSPGYHLPWPKCSRPPGANCRFRRLMSVAGQLALLAGRAPSRFHSAPSMSSIDTNVGSPPIVSRTSPSARSRVDARGRARRSRCHCSSVYGLVTRGDS